MGTIIEYRLRDAWRERQTDRLTDKWSSTLKTELVYQPSLEKLTTT